MTELEKIQRAQSYIKKLGDGIDPISDCYIPEDSILNNVRMARCFLYVADILSKVIANGGEVTASEVVAPKKRSRAPLSFAITNEEISRIVLSTTPISISHVCERISEVVDLNDHKKLKATAVTSWLVQKGFLAIDNSESGKSRKIPTDLSASIGIFAEEKSFDGRSYLGIYYTIEAQQFIVDNIQDIIESTESVARADCYKPFPPKNAPAIKYENDSAKAPEEEFGDPPPQSDGYLTESTDIPDLDDFDNLAADFPSNYQSSVLDIEYD